MSDSVKDEEAIPANTVLGAEIENDIVSEIDQAEQVSEIGDDLEADDDAFSSDPLQKVSIYSLFTNVHLYDHVITIRNLVL